MASDLSVSTEAAGGSRPAGTRGVPAASPPSTLTAVARRGDLGPGERHPHARPRRPRRLSARPGILFAIAAGGVLGACSRYELSLVVVSRPGTFPLATFAINASGSFFLGALLALLIERWRPSEYLRPFAATGFLGAYTTWSTFMVDTDNLARAGHVALAVAYVAASLTAGLAAVSLGMAVVRARAPVPRRRDPGEES